MNITINDTIACDTTRLNSFINSGNYDYNSEIGEAEKSLFEKVMNDFYHWLEGIFKDLFHVENALFSSDSKMLYVWIVVAVIGILALLYFMYKRKMLFFNKKAKDEDDYEVVEDTIYGIDFEKEIADAIESGNYRKAIRLRYLQCLKTLSDNDAIDWRIHKTPTQYTREFKNEDFKNLTRQYVLVRYGGYKATPEIYEYICDKYKIIVSKLSVNMNLESSQEGGDNEA